MSLTLGLALGGGGARGAAHIGILQVLHENGVHIDRIAGTSAGAVIGAMYAYKQDPYWIERRFKEFLDSPDFQEMGTARVLDDRNPHSAMGQLANLVRDKFILIMSQQKSYIIKRERLEKAFKFLVPINLFNDVSIPMEIAVTDLQKGEILVRNSGNLIDALVQSSSIPGYVQPTEIGNQVLVDGGVIEPIPVNLLKNKVDYILASSIAKKKLPKIESMNMFEILTRADQITSNCLAFSRLEHADLVFEPDVGGLHWSRFDQFDILLQHGRDEALAKMDTLKETLKMKSNFGYRLKQKLGLTV